MKTLKFEITGTSPLIMHSERLADPLDPFAQAMKKLNGKKTKTDEDYAELAFLEFQGSLYHSEGSPYLPIKCIEATIRDAARSQRRGADVTRAVMVIGLDLDRTEFNYEGPKDPQELYNAGFRDRRSVKVQKSRVMRTRPKFPAGWKSRFDVMFDPEIFNADDVVGFLEYAGHMVGICDYRPRYGKFSVEVL